MPGTLDSMFVDLSDRSACNRYNGSTVQTSCNRYLPEAVRSNAILNAIIDAGIPTLKTTEDPWENSDRWNETSSEGGVNALLTPAVDIGNGFVARTHVMGGEVLISPAQYPHRLFIRRFKETPTIQPLADNKFRISGTTIDGQVVQDEVALAA